ncbi:MAG: response regulator transcription factor [Cyanobacterium sp. T60_A2020_053]|nr:response regulator transcription factor [Cyanobacterium sp. T60_A2020_053]
MSSILLVEDELELGASLTAILSHEAYEVQYACDGGKALELLTNHRFDLVILDWMLPLRTGLEICLLLRNPTANYATLSNTPVLFLTAKDTLDDRVLGLDAGADDYLIKPFELRELLARVRALLRRTGKEEKPQELSSHLLRLNNIELDQLSQLAYRDGKLLKLSEKEFKLLEFFLLNSHQLVTQEQIYQYLWSEDEAPSSNVVVAVVRLLRRKVESKNQPILIHTIYGKGYWFGKQD